MPANLTTAIDIAATPERVWTIVSDLGRMGEWSPQTRKVIVRGGEVKQGTTTVNINRQGWKVWPTQSKVVDFEPNRRIASRCARTTACGASTSNPPATAAPG